MNCNDIKPRIYLAVSEHAMFFPYPSDKGEGRKDSLQNYGGKLLKCNLKQIEEVPEVENDLPLKDFLKIINSKESAFISLGCNSFVNEAQESGCFAGGYIQISFNDKSLIDNPNNYFNLFLEFNQFVTMEVKNLPVIFTWKLEEVRFDTVNSPSTPIATGFSIIIGIDTDYLPDKETSKAAWNFSLKVLSDYFSNKKFDLENQIYECENYVDK